MICISNASEMYFKWKTNAFHKLIIEFVDTNVYVALYSF